MKMYRKICAFVLLLCMVISSASAAYSRFDAITYADRYVFDPNTPPIAGGYPVYDSDCANFVSQCLYAGGLPHDSTWYSILKTSGTGISTWRDDSNAWTVAEDLKNYLSGLGATKLGSWSKYGSDAPYTTYAWTNNSSNMTSTHPGRTVIFYDWEADGKMNHSSFLVANNTASYDGTGTGDLINQHTEDRRRTVWHLNDHNTKRNTTRIYAFALNV